MNPLLFELLKITLIIGSMIIIICIIDYFQWRKYDKIHGTVNRFAALKSIWYR